MNAKRPNVVCLISDDTDPDNLGCYGATDYLTPHLDALARAGMLFTRAHAVSPVCTPARYAYLTGQYPGRCPNGFRQNNPTDRPYNITWNTDLAPGQANLAGMFAAAGYTTGYVGKFHCGRGPAQLGLEQLPPRHNPHDPANDAIHQRNHARVVKELNSYGWLDVRNVCWGNLDFNPFQDVPHNLEWTTQGALDFLDAHARDDQPFLLYVGYQAIHGPKHGEDLEQIDPRVTVGGLLDEPVTSDQPSRASVLERLRAAGVDTYHRNVGALWLDDGVGAVLRKLAALGLDENTIVIYKADHGKFGKGTCYQNGSHVPMIWRWPGQIQADTRCLTMVQHIDFLPTLAELCHVEIPASYQLDGASYARHLTAGVTTPLREDFYNEMGLTRSVQTERWKLICLRWRPEDIAAFQDPKTSKLPAHIARGVDASVAYHPAYFDADQLYEIQQDRGECLNLAHNPAYAPVLAEMKQRLQRYLATFEHPFPLKPDAFQNSERYRTLARQTLDTLTESLSPGSVFGDRYW